MDDMFNQNEPIIQKLRILIRFSVRCLAVLMTLVILFGVVDVAWEIYEKLRTPPVMLMNISDILATFGAFMAVLIAIEIFINITIYLRDDVIHVKIVMATALMAIARKVIILDFTVISPDYIFATAALVFAMGIGYWLVARYADTHSVKRSQVEKCFEHPDECTLEESERKL
ncbi:MAG TPA: phosphate-starvation-inducible PsiE family protein [Desulfotignum sp.]|nr:phosphate-starvation-inducible PsiE family protein [Desulfotignum sp.]